MMLLVLGLVGVRKLMKEPERLPIAVRDTKLFGGAHIATEIGQFMPSGPKEPHGVTAEELQWAREQGASNNDEAADLIAEHRRSMSGEVA